MAQGHARARGSGSLRGPQLSLLLDALKRAEQEKLARQPGTSAAAPPVRPVAVPAPGGPSLELQPIATPGGAASHAAHAAPAARADTAAHAAQNVFQAKAGDADAPRNRTVLWTMFGAIAFVAIAAAAYVWYSVKSLTPQYAGAPRPRAAPTPPPASGAPLPLPPTAAMGSIVPAPGAVVPAQVAPEASPSAAAPVAAAKATSPPAPTLTTAERLERAAAEARPPPPLPRDRSAENPRRVPAQVAQGYESLQRGDFAAARRGYAAALASDPTNADAHLGMATIEARSANRAVAAEHYRRVLELDPRNATALAGLAALADFSRPDALEAQLQADLARFPESSALQFTLGNLYAAQARWVEAQAAYFEAHRLDPGSAEIAHNLAVSLDHVGQRRLAAGFYRRALEGARGRIPPFDAAAVARRLAELD